MKKNKHPLNIAKVVFTTILVTTLMGCASKKSTPEKILACEKQGTVDQCGTFTKEELDRFVSKTQLQRFEKKTSRFATLSWPGRLREIREAYHSGDHDELKRKVREYEEMLISIIKEIQHHPDSAPVNEIPFCKAENFCEKMFGLKTVGDYRKTIEGEIDNIRSFRKWLESTQNIRAYIEKYAAVMKSCYQTPSAISCSLRRAGEPAISKGQPLSQVQMQEIWKTNNPELSLPKDKKDFKPDSMLNEKQKKFIAYYYCGGDKSFAQCFPVNSPSISKNSPDVPTDSLDEATKENMGRQSLDLPIDEAPSEIKQPVTPAPAPAPESGPLS